MKRLWYYAVRTYVSLGLKFFYKKIIVKNASNIPSDEAVIFVANHQNAFLDAIVIACTNSKYGHFLVRADIFRKAWAARLLNSLNMMPAYRIRDGWQSLGKNQETFDRCEKILADRNAVIIFPEGNHASQRRLRNLSKGFTRVAFEGIKKHPNLKIYIVPVGLNYSNIQAFRGGVSVYYGEPVLANDYFSVHDVASATQLKEEVGSRLKKLITHVEDESRYDAVMSSLELSAPDYLDPIETNRRIAVIENGKPIKVHTRSQSSKSVLHFALSLSATALNIFPLLLWGHFRKKIKDPVFIGSVKFVFGIFVFPIYSTLAAVFVYLLAGPEFAIAFFFILLCSLLYRTGLKRDNK